MRNVVHRRHLAVVGQFAEPLPAPCVRIRQLQLPPLPVLVEIHPGPVAVAVSHHDILLPLSVFHEHLRTQGHHIPPCLVVCRNLQHPVVEEMLPSRLVVFRRARLVTVNARHAEIRRQVPAEQPQAMIKLLHLREVEVQHVFLSRKILHRHARLDAVIRTVIARQIAHAVYSHLHRQPWRYPYMIVVEQRYLIYRLMAHTGIRVKRSQLVHLVRVFGSPLRTVDILERIVEFRRYVHRPYAAAYIPVGFRAQHLAPCPVRMRRVKHRRTVAQLARLRMIRQLIYLILPPQYRRVLLLVQQRQVIIVPRTVCQEAERTHLRQGIRQFRIVVVRSMVQPVLFRQQPVEEIQPAPSGTHHVRQLVLHDRSLQRSRSRRHIQRQRTHMLLLVALLQVHLRHRRKPALQMRIEKTFVKHHVLHCIAVENRQQRVDMPRMKHRDPVQQKLVLVVASAVHLQVAPRQR